MSDIRTFTACVLIVLVGFWCLADIEKGLHRAAPLGSPHWVGVALNLYLLIVAATYIWRGRK